MVESGGDTNAVGDNSLAVGVLQIHPIMVKDVNRILGEDKFTLDDRYDRAKSIAMCRIYLRHYGDNMTKEQLARMWNGSPDGWRNDSQWFVRNRGLTLKQAQSKISNTKKYWKKVKAIVESAK